MNWIAQFVVTRARLAWALALLVAGILGLGATEIARFIGERERVSVLQTEAERRSVEIMSQTLNSNLMGSLSLLGLIHADVKTDTLPGTAPNDPQLVEVLENVGRSYDAESIYIVGADGVVKSSWDNSGRPNSGLNVKFRPYHQMGMQGTPNVYAAVSLTSGVRSLYFAVPVYSATASDSKVVGVAVARTTLFKIDDLLRTKEKSDVSLLLSPQGVVFAGSRRDWVGRLASEPAPERLKAIRELKQFGSVFEKEEPALLPVAVDENLQTFEGRRYAIASARVQWNDPFGEWTIVLMEDLTRSVPLAARAWIGAASAAAILLFSLLFLLMLRGRYAQNKAAEQMQAHAQRQEALARGKSRLAQASMQLQQATTLETLAQVFLRETNQLLGALQGAVYVVDAQAQQRLKLVASYGAAADVPASLAFGDGLLGQCALDAKPIFMEAPTQAYWRISSGLGATMPRMVALMPLLRSEAVLGVVELAALKPFDADAHGVLDELLPLLALNLEIVLRNQLAEGAAATSAAAERELARLGDVDRFNRLAQGREQRIVEVKRLANELARKTGATIPFASVEIEQANSPDAAGADDQTAPAPDAKKLRLAELVDLAELQVLFSNFCEAVGVAAAIIDLEGKVLASARWQRACTDFHRAVPGSCARCIESDTELALKLQDGAEFTMYQCKNGMTDCASPIVVERQHLANVFIGQFHLRPPDLSLFAEQAKQYGYPEAEYLQAVGEAPVMDEKRLPVILGFLAGFARMVATMSLARYRADEAQVRLQRERVAAMSLAEDADQARRALEARNMESMK